MVRQFEVGDSEVFSNVVGDGETDTALLIDPDSD